MTSSRPRLRLSAGLAGIALAVAACGGGGGDDAGGDDGGSPPDTTISPIAELMGWENPSPEESNRKQLEVEEMVAECMREEGWEYLPVDYSAMNQMSPEDQESMELQMNDPEAFGKKYGYGVVRNYELYELPNLEAGGEGGPGVTVADNEFKDPNQPYIDSLTESEREQYQISLYGDQSVWEGSEDDDFVQPTPEQMGCQGRASTEVWGGNPADSNPDIQNRMNDYWENAEDDPRLQDAYATWRDCMGDAIDGLAVLDDPVEAPQDIYSYFDSRKFTLMGLEMEPYDESMDGEEGGAPYVMASTNSDGTGVAYTGEQHPIAEADLEQLRQEEIEMWQQDWDCQQMAKISDVRHDLEQEFVDQLRAEFPELAATEE